MGSKQVFSSSQYILKLWKRLFLSTPNIKEEPPKNNTT